MKPVFKSLRILGPSGEQASADCCPGRPSSRSSCRWTLSQPPRAPPGRHRREQRPRRSHLRPRRRTCRHSRLTVSLATLQSKGRSGFHRCTPAAIRWTSACPRRKDRSSIKSNAQRRSKWSKTATWDRPIPISPRWGWCSSRAPGRSAELPKPHEHRRACLAFREPWRGDRRPAAVVRDDSDLQPDGPLEGRDRLGSGFSRVVAKRPRNWSSSTMHRM